MAQIYDLARRRELNVDECFLLFQLQMTASQFVYIILCFRLGKIERLTKPFVVSAPVVVAASANPPQTPPPPSHQASSSDVDSSSDAVSTPSSTLVPPLPLSGNKSTAGSSSPAPNSSSTDQQDVYRSLPIIGDRVFVTTKRLPATVRFVGNTHFAEGTWVGVELEDKGAGKNDGRVDGHVYFRCPDDQGLFVKLSSVFKRGIPQAGKYSGSAPLWR